MPRKRLPIIAGDLYHISARCINREWFQHPLENIWEIMEDYLSLIARFYGIEIYSFVLMSNHFHLLARAPEGNLSAALLYFLRETSKEIGRATDRINQIFANRHHKTHLSSYHYFMNTYKYVYRNPVRAKICTHVEEYPYSTIHGLLGRSRLSIPIAEDKILFPDNFDETALKWLNTSPDAVSEDLVRRALRRSEFQLKTCRKTGRLSRLESELL